jgi:hypothetical protein
LCKFGTYEIGQQRAPDRADGAAKAFIAVEVAAGETARQNSDAGLALFMSWLKKFVESRLWD